MRTSPVEGGSSTLAPDTLIFHVTRDGLSLVGGSGRALGWTGIVDLPLDGEPLAARVHGSSRPARVGTGDPMRVVGPYWAKHAVLVPAGAEHLVVFGGDEPLPDRDAILIRAAAHLVAELGDIAPAKLLADELEVVHAIRDLVQYRPERVADTARHIARKAAEPLSCEVGAVLVRYDGQLIAEVVTREWPAGLNSEAIKSTLTDLFERVEQGAVLELDLEENAGDALGRTQGLVAVSRCRSANQSRSEFSSSPTPPLMPVGSPTSVSALDTHWPTYPNRCWCRPCREKD